VKCVKEKRTINGIDLGNLGALTRGVDDWEGVGGVWDPRIFLLTPSSSKSKSHFSFLKAPISSMLMFNIFEPLSKLLN